ncbi:unnamed protein product, partial [Vitis vinifera]|uniref:Uncharacterized protein n=1 Tax=Vitis vinifera TaxID=29760 RepID=D7U723_VITVI
MFKVKLYANLWESHPSKLKLTSGAQNILVLVELLNTALLTRYYTMKLRSSEDRGVVADLKKAQLI